MPKTNTPLLLRLAIISILALASTVKVTFAADITAPVTTVVKTPASPNGKNGWYVSPVQFDLTATDLETGVKSINYRIDNGIWQTISFDNSLNLAPNPSFEILGATSTGADGWEASVFDGNATYSRDTGAAYTGFGSASARIVATDGTWHGIDNMLMFAVASPFGNMSASTWVKTNSVTGNALFKIYSVSQDGSGVITHQEIAQSSTTVTGTVDWTQLTSNFVVNDPNAIGVYIDIGLDSPGTLWIDAVNISESITTANTSFTVANDAESHTVEYYSTDQTDNAEIYNCATSTNCITFKLDQTPPGQWFGSGASRGLLWFLTPEYVLWTYTNVRDATSGLSILSDKYQIKTELNPGFGRFSNFLSCSSTWLPNSWMFLITPPFTNGVKEVYLISPKASFCNNNWNNCKLVRFYAEDMAGNGSTKEFCVNGPWIRLSGEGTIRSNDHIDMLAESNDDNTDGLIEVANTDIDYFTSSTDWEVTNSTTPEELTYSDYYNLVTSSKTEISDGHLLASDGVYRVSGNLQIDAGDIPGSYDDAEFDQVVFVDGDFRIEADVDINNDSTALFIVSGNVEIGKDVLLLDIAIFADGEIFTAYDVEEDDSTETLVLQGIFSADKFNFQRTLLGTDNNSVPSEDFIFEPKYAIQQKDFFGKSSISWKNIN